MNASRPLRALVIGAGPAAEDMHLAVLARLRDRREIELAVVCDLESHRAAMARRKFGFAEDGGDAIGSLARADVDAVYIFGSAQLHHEYGLAALRNGKHLFVEKPVAPSYAQACELVREARARGLVAVGGHNRRFYRSLTALRERSMKGGWRFVEAVFHKPEAGRPPPYGARTWLSANGIHALDAVLFMMGGPPEHLTARASGAGAPQPDAFSALMSWKDGAQAIFLCNNSAGSRREEYVFHGTGESCTATLDRLVVERHGGAVDEQAGSFADSIVAEHESFLRAIRGGGSPPHALDRIAASLFLAERIEEGFCGAIQVPGLDSASDGVKEPGSTSILVVQPAGLQAALTHLLAGHRIVTLEDLQREAHPRPDVIAAILGSGAPPLPPEILAKLPRLAVVGVVGLSVARYGADELLARDVELVNASDAHADSVAELALGLAILGRRRGFQSHEVMRRGGWGVVCGPSGVKERLRRIGRRARPLLRAVGLEPTVLRLWRASGARSRAGIQQSRELQGAVAGLVGWGANARAFTERLLRANVRVLVHSEHASSDEIRRSGAIPVSLAEALSADIVSLHRGLTKATRHCLGRVELEKLRPGALLINVARAALIEPDALLARLRRGDIFACLDTFESEPLDRSHPLRALPNVFLTSHIAGGSTDMHEAAAEEVVRKVAARLAGRSVAVVSADRLRTMT